MIEAGWTSQRPNREGVYWFRWSVSSRPLIVSVAKDDCAWRVLEMGNQYDGSLAGYSDGEWLGPITPDSYQQGRVDQSIKEEVMNNQNFNFSRALEEIKAGHKVARARWNGKNMFLFLVPGSTFKVNRPPLLGIYEEGTEINYCPHIDMRTADGKIVPWLCSQTDMLANDWEIAR